MGEGKALRSILAHERRVVTERTRSRVQPTKNDFLRKRVAGVRGGGAWSGGGGQPPGTRPRGRPRTTWRGYISTPTRGRPRDHLVRSEMVDVVTAKMSRDVSL